MYKKSLNVVLKYLTRRKKPFRRRINVVGRLAKWLKRWTAAQKVPGSNLLEFKCFSFLLFFIHKYITLFFLLLMNKCSLLHLFTFSTFYCVIFVFKR